MTGMNFRGGRAMVCALAIAWLAGGASAQPEAMTDYTVVEAEHSRVAGLKRPIERSEGFFGIHFDLHANKGDTMLGADATLENYRQFIATVKPDWVQWDCKGHAGYTGYPTKIGWPAPGIVKDTLAIWREATREAGIPLGIHYSGVWDMVATQNNPDWAVVDPEGTPVIEHNPSWNPRNVTSLFSPYVDELMIPQLKEIVDNYDIDSIWVDGDAWGAELDWHERAIAAWKAETGYETVPRKRGDEHWDEWKNFHRRAFLTYLERWVDALHEYDPTLDITSNWMYTRIAPAEPGIGLDFISGDFDPNIAVERARIETRYMQHLGKPWDLMAWGFARSENQDWTIKTPIQLMQEAAVVLMHGGAFQVYYNPTRSGYVNSMIAETAAQVGEFARRRQVASFESAPVPQAVVLYSVATQLDRSDKPYSAWWFTTEKDHVGALRMMLENHFSTDMMAEWMLEDRLEEYPLLVIAEAYKLPEAFRRRVIEYVENGGSLLLLGHESARLFEEHLGVTFDGEPAEVKTQLYTPLGLVSANAEWQAVEPAGAEVVAWRMAPPVTTKGSVDPAELGEQFQAKHKKVPAATLNRVGEGKILAFHGPIGTIYYNEHQPGIRRLVGEAARLLFPEPAVKVDAPPTVDISLRTTRAGQPSLHLMNRSEAPISAAKPIIDYIPEVGPIVVRWPMAEAPEAVRWISDRGRLAWKWADGELIVQIDELWIHGVVVVDG